MMTTSFQANRQGPRATGVERYVTFLVAGETYAVPALSVREVIRWVSPARVPNAGPSVKGVINLRGEIVTVLDLRTRLDLPSAEPTDRTCIVVVTLQRGAIRHQAGLIVDTALDVTRMTSLGWEPVVDFRDGLQQTVRWYQEHPEWWRPLKSGEYWDYYRKNYKNK